MTSFKLLGFTDGERALFQTWLPSAHWELGNPEALKVSVPADEVWVVRSDAAEVFQAACRRDERRSVAEHSTAVKAILWVPTGTTLILFDDWWEDFIAQLMEESRADRNFLARIAQCARVVEWDFHVEDIPVSWFDELDASPRCLDISKLPFSFSDRAHLHGCAICTAEVYDQLQQYVDRRQAVRCPSVDVLQAWLIGQEYDRALESHLRTCRSCRAALGRLGGLFIQADMMDETDVQQRLTTLHHQTWRSPSVSPAAPWRPPEVIPFIIDPTQPLTLGMFTVDLLSSLQARFPSSTATALTRGYSTPHLGAVGMSIPFFGHVLGMFNAIRVWPRQIPDISASTIQTLRDQGIEFENPATREWIRLLLTDEGLRIYTTVESPSTLASATSKSTSFRINFWRGDDSVLAVIATGGYVLITEDTMSQIKSRTIDRITITEDE